MHEHAGICIHFLKKKNCNALGNLVNLPRSKETGNIQGGIAIDRLSKSLGEKSLKANGQRFSSMGVYLAYIRPQACPVRTTKK